MEACTGEMVLVWLKSSRSHATAMSPALEAVPRIRTEDCAFGLRHDVSVGLEDCARVPAEFRNLFLFPSDGGSHAGFGAAGDHADDVGEEPLAFGVRVETLVLFELGDVAGWILAPELDGFAYCVERGALGRAALTASLVGAPLVSTVVPLRRVRRRWTLRSSARWRGLTTRASGSWATSLRTRVGYAPGRVVMGREQVCPGTRPHSSEFAGPDRLSTRDRPHAGTTGSTCSSVALAAPGPSAPLGGTAGAVSRAAVEPPQRPMLSSCAGSPGRRSTRERCLDGQHRLVRIRRHPPRRVATARSEPHPALEQCHRLPAPLDAVAHPSVFPLSVAPRTQHGPQRQLRGSVALRAGPSAVGETACAPTRRRRWSHPGRRGNRARSHEPGWWSWTSATGHGDVPGKLQTSAPASAPGAVQGPRILSDSCASAKRGRDSTSGRWTSQPLHHATAAPPRACRDHPQSAKPLSPTTDCVVDAPTGTPVAR